MEVSTSGYYNWLSTPELQREDAFEVEIIQLIFESKREKAGARLIKMFLERNFFIRMNLKKVRRIMKKYNLQTKIRRRSKYNAFSAKNEIHASVPNYLDRNFEVQEDEKVLSTDITYLDYGNGQRAYLSAVKDLTTKEIVHYKLSRSLGLSLAIEGIEQLYSQLASRNRNVVMVHSDQGSHYTSQTYRSILEGLNILQSMSRRGNCLDNAPIESFFGHMKDELEYKTCRTYEELEEAVNIYIHYYNYQRPQWGLKGKTPAECQGSYFGALY